MSSGTPTVICLDLDNNIIGNIKYQVCEWEILKQFDKSKLKAFRANLCAILRHTLMIRLDFKYFITQIAARFSHIEFFIYTGSERKWATFLIDCLEEVLQIKFNRPLLTRDYCLFSDGGMSKCLRRVAPVIYRSLKKKYPLMTPKHILNNSVLIDNAKYNNENLLMIKSWSYNYEYPSDILRLINEEVLRNQTRGICKLLAKYSIGPKISSKSHMSYEEFIVLYYERFAKQLSSNLHHEKQFSQDHFWKKLVGILAMMKSLEFKTNTLAYINTKLKNR